MEDNQLAQENNASDSKHLASANPEKKTPFDPYSMIAEREDQIKKLLQTLENQDQVMGNMNRQLAALKDFQHRLIRMEKTRTDYEKILTEIQNGIPLDQEMYLKINEALSKHGRR